MKSVPDWTTPTDIRNEVRWHWRRGRILAARLEDTPLFPLAVKFRRPDSKALSEQFDEVQKWIIALEEESKPVRGFGYDIVWSEINHRQIGHNRLPAGLRLASERDALRLIGMWREAERFSALADLIVGQFPVLRDWLVRHPFMALNLDDDWPRILALLTLLRDNPRVGSNLHQISIPATRQFNIEIPDVLREIYIPGIDSNFIEDRKGVLAELLGLVLPPADTSAPDAEYTVQLASRIGTSSGARASAGAGDVTGTARRAEIISRLQSLIAEIDQLIPLIEGLEGFTPRRGIGGNYPPEPIDDIPLDAEQLKETALTANILERAILSESLNLELLDLCRIIFKNTVNSTKNFIQWIGDEGKLFLDEFLRSAGNSGGKKIWTVAIAIGVSYNLHSSLSQIIAQIEQLLRLLH